MVEAGKSGKLEQYFGVNYIRLFTTVQSYCTVPLHIMNHCKSRDYTKRKLWLETEKKTYATLCSVMPFCSVNFQQNKRSRTRCPFLRRSIDLQLPPPPGLFVEEDCLDYKNGGDTSKTRNAFKKNAR